MPLRMDPKDFFQNGINMELVKLGVIVIGIVAIVAVVVIKKK